MKRNVLNNIGTNPNIVLNMSSLKNYMMYSKAYSTIQFRTIYSNYRM